MPMTIKPEPRDTAAPKTKVPTGYELAPDSAVPGEGSHWINPQAPEFQGAPHGFDHTFVYGSYSGRMSQRQMSYLPWNTT